MCLKHFPPEVLIIYVALLHQTLPTLSHDTAFLRLEKVECQLESNI